MRRVTAIEFADSKAYIFFAQSKSIVLENPEIPENLAKDIKNNGDPEVHYIRMTSGSSFAWYRKNEEIAIPSEIKYSLENLVTKATKNK